MYENLHPEHGWLEQLLGEWTFESEMSMEPGAEPVRTTGTETVRSLGGFWVLAESRFQTMGGTPAAAVMTLGFDPRRQRYVGSYIGSMMSHQWVYDGAVDAAGRTLTLETEGPSFTGEAPMVPYRDIVEILDANHRTLSSEVLEANGQWRHFMTMRFERQTPG